MLFACLAWVLIQTEFNYLIKLIMYFVKLIFLSHITKLYS